MSQTGSTSRTVGSLGSSTDSGSMEKQKADFSDKHRKVIRILTVVAYIMSVSTAALLLSAYYVFLWKPAPSDPLTLSRRPTDSPSTMAHHGYTNYPSYSNQNSNAYGRHISSALHSPYPSDATRSTKVSKKGYHVKPTSYHMVPTPQGLIMEKLIFTMSSTTTPQRAPASPPDDPKNPSYRVTTPKVAPTSFPTQKMTMKT